MRTIESIVVYNWKAEYNRWIGEFVYEKRMKSLEITGYKGLRTCTTGSTAAVLAS